MLVVRIANFLYEELLPSHYSLGIVPTALQCVKFLLATIFHMYWYIYWMTFPITECVIL